MFRKRRLERSEALCTSTQTGLKSATIPVTGCASREDSHVYESSCPTESGCGGWAGSPGTGAYHVITPPVLELMKAWHRVLRHVH